MKIPEEFWLLLGFALIALSICIGLALMSLAGVELE